VERSLDRSELPAEEEHGGVVGDSALGAQRRARRQTLGRLLEECVVDGVGGEEHPVGGHTVLEIEASVQAADGEEGRGAPKEPAERQPLHQATPTGRFPKPVTLPTNDHRDAQDRGGNERQPARGVGPAVNDEGIEAAMPQLGDDPRIDETEERARSSAAVQVRQDDGSVAVQQRNVPCELCRESRITIAAGPLIGAEEHRQIHLGSARQHTEQRRLVLDRVRREKRDPVPVAHPTGSVSSASRRERRNASIPNAARASFRRRVASSRGAGQVRESTCLIAVRRAPSCSGSMSNPSRPSSSASREPSRPQAITGVPHASDSMKTMPKPSLRDGITNTSAAENRSGSSCSEMAPMKSTASATPNRWASAIRRGMSSPVPPIM